MLHLDPFDFFAAALTCEIPQAGEAFEGRDDAGETLVKIKSTQCNWRPVR